MNNSQMAEEIVLGGITLRRRGADWHATGPYYLKARLGKDARPLDIRLGGEWTPDDLLVKVLPHLRPDAQTRFEQAVAKLTSTVGWSTSTNSRQQCGA